MGITINTMQILSIDYKFNYSTRKHFLLVYMANKVTPDSNKYSFGFTSLGRYQDARKWFDKALETDLNFSYEVEEV